MKREGETLYNNLFSARFGVFLAILGSFFLPSWGLFPARSRYGRKRARNADHLGAELLKAAALSHKGVRGEYATCYDGESIPDTCERRVKGRRLV